MLLYRIEYEVFNMTNTADTLRCMGGGQNPLIPDTAVSPTMKVGEL